MFHNPIWKRAIAFIIIFSIVSSSFAGELSLPSDKRWIMIASRSTFEEAKQLADYYKQINANLILVHPDLVEDWKIFDQYKLNWAIENMDNQKQRYKTSKELSAFFPACRSSCLVFPPAWPPRIFPKVIISRNPEDRCK